MELLPNSTIPLLPTVIFPVDVTLDFSVYIPTEEFSATPEALKIVSPVVIFPIFTTFELFTEDESAFTYIPADPFPNVTSPELIISVEISLTILAPFSLLKFAA